MSYLEKGLTNECIAKPEISIVHDIFCIKTDSFHRLLGGINKMLKLVWKLWAIYRCLKLKKTDFFGSWWKTLPESSKISTQLKTCT